MSTEILTLPILSDNYTYLIIDEGHAVVVDPGHAKPINKVLSKRKLEVDAILVTHEDHDHIGGIEALHDHYACPVYGPDMDKIPHLSNPVQGGDTLSLLYHQLQVIATPGHRAQDVSYYFPDMDVLFCGDVLFTGGCGRRNTDSAQVYWNSLQAINRLPARTKMYGGHEYALENYRFAAEMTAMHIFVERYEWAQHEKCTVPTTLEEERRSNIFLRSGDPAVIDVCGLHGHQPWEVFDYLRTEKNSF